MAEKVSTLNQEHPDYRMNISTWEDIRLLFNGGAELKANAKRFVQQRLAEPATVYDQRIKGFTYQNVIAAALGWYAGKLFTQPPEITFKPEDEFLTGFLSDCDRQGTDLNSMLRLVAEDVLQFGCSWILTDLPDLGMDFPNLAAQREAGALDPYLVHYCPTQVINWGESRNGLEWCVIRTREDINEFLSPNAGKIRTKWYYFDRTNFRVWERIGDRHELASDELADEIASGLHALARFNRVPVHRVKVLDSLWLATNVIFMASERVSHENALSWALLQSCLAILVIYTDNDPEVKRSEVAWLKLSPDDKAEYLEQSGESIRLMAEKIATLREEIYRGLYLIAQGREASAQPAVQSGVAKEVEMSSAEDVLKALGDALRPHVAAILQSVVDARGDLTQTKVSVTGFDFDDGPSIDELSIAERVIGMEIPSETLRKEVFKRMAHKMVGEDDPKLIQAIEAEIDAAPTLEEQRKKEFEEQMAMRTTAIGGALKGGKK